VSIAVHRVMQVVYFEPGDLISIHALGQLTIVVNSARAAHELFALRSGIYADRPRIPIFDLYVPFSLSLVTLL